MTAAPTLPGHGLVAAVKSGVDEAAGREALQRLAAYLGWDEPGRGTFGRVIPPGASVVVKPNLVLHENQGPWGIEPLVTNPALIRAVVEEALASGASTVIVGDAPIQGCDFERLLARTGLDAWADDLRRREPRFDGVLDFRRTTCTFVDGVRVATEDLQPAENFVMFDLAGESLLEPVTDDRGIGRFRVTCYDPRLMRATHAHGRHRYLVAKQFLDADVVINVPKLKTHKKAGITCALKNLVGINGNKEFLPHHRVGSPKQGGDCYERSNVIRRAIELALDRQNMASSPGRARMINGVVVQLHRLARLARQNSETEGSWSGNDTVWRMCLDLNRILLYGAPDASVDDRIRRRVIHVADGVVAGQGNGPLSPEPLDLGLVLGSDSGPALDWVASTLLRYDPRRISLTREAFGTFRWPLAVFGPETIAVEGDLGAGKARATLASYGADLAVTHPHGWRDASVPGNAPSPGWESLPPREMIVE